VSQLTGALGTMDDSPCCPSKVPWWGRAAVPRSWALQTWIEMAKYGVGTNAVIRSSAMPRKYDRHVLTAAWQTENRKCSSGRHGPESTG